ncbi:hypothetical protein ACEPAF_7110 [Sanghuangporus sanghuang]
MARHPPPLLRPSVLYVLAIVLLDARAVYTGSIQLHRRGATTDAACISEFDWMSNSKSQSPCLVAAYLLAPCQVTGNGNVREIANTTYLAPTAEGAEACWCSWGVYNTLEACASCQNNSNYLLSWYNYRTNCSAELQPNTEFYPSDNIISEETSVPFWATKDPSTWDSGTFNLTQAQVIDSEGKEDVTQESRAAASSSASASSSGSSATSTETGNSSDDGSSVNVGAIAGGVAGGVVAIAAAGLAAFFFMRRRKKTEPQWDYKAPDMTVSPLVAPDLPGSQPLMGGYSDFGRSDSVARIQTTSNLRVDLASPVHEANTGYFAGSSGYGGGNTFTAVSSSSDAGPQPNTFLAEPSPPPYTDNVVVATPAKGR